MKQFTFKLLISILYSLFAFVNTSFAQERKNIKKEIEKIIHFDTEINLTKTPGYIIGVMVEDSTFVFKYGHQDRTEATEINENSVFEIGSLSKVYTAALVQVLVDEGKLTYKTTLNSLLKPEDQNESAAHLSIHDLITHQSGLPRLPFEFGTFEKEINNPYAHYTKKDLLEFYKNYSFDKKKNSKYNYSHVNYALLEVALENKMNTNFETLLSEKIIEPLNLQNTFIKNNKETTKKYFTKGHTTGDLEVPFWTFQSFAGAEGIKTNMIDLLKFTSANMGLVHTPLNDGLEKLHQEVSKTGMSKFTFMAKGWHLVKHKRYYDLLLHSGSTSGYRSFVGFVKETKTAVIILTNSEFRTNGLGLMILEMLNHQWRKKKK